MPDENKFLKITWQQIVSAVVAMLFVGAISWMGATLKSKMTEIDNIGKRLILVETFLGGEYRKDFEYVKEKMGEINLQMGSFSANQRRAEIIISRLEAIVERLERSVR